MFTPNVIPNKHTAKVKSNEKRPRKELGCALCFSVEYKIKRKFTFFLANTKYISSHAVKISVFSRYALVKNTDFFTALDEIYLVFTSKKNILYVSVYASVQVAACL